MKPTALITGVTGQDGHYLAEQLVSREFKVYGLVRRTAYDAAKVAGIPRGVDVVEGDICDSACMQRVVRSTRPDYVYNLAALSYVGESWNAPISYMRTNTEAVLYMLEAIREQHPQCRFYQASTSEMYGNSLGGGGTLDEQSPMYPRSPYGIAKLAAYHAVRNYRESHSLFAVNGILFNHESPRRDERFVTRKITRAAARIKYGLQSTLELGSLTARRDWGHARDYVRGMQLMLEAETPNDYVLATGYAYSVLDFVIAAFDAVGLDYKRYVVGGTAKNLRPAEIFTLVGNPARASAELGWEPDTIFTELVLEMVEHDCGLAAREAEQTGEMACKSAL